MLALDRGVAEAFSVEVLRGVTSAVASVPDDRHHHLLVALVAREHALESLRQVEEVILSSNLRLKDLGSYDGSLSGVDRESALGVLVARVAVSH